MLVGMMQKFKLFVRPFGLNRRIKGENRSVGGKMNPNAIRKGGKMILELPPELSEILRNDPERLDEVLGIIADFYLESTDEHQLQ